jgi:serine protease Do
MKRVAAIVICVICFGINFIYADLHERVARPIQLTSFADVIEPLLPAVVNIYTIKYSNNSNNISRKSDAFSEFFPFEQFDNFFEKFNVPFALKELYSNPRAMALGSGFIIDDSGLIVTNHHVVANSDEIHIKLFDNREVPAVIVGSDPKTDLALLKIESSEKLPFVKFGDATKARIGDVVIAIGNPFGFGGTVTTGIISSKARDLGFGADELVDNFIQTDAAINSGNSGGPLFNIDGKVIGVNTSISAAGGGMNIGIGFAIPSNTAKDIIEQLKDGGKINRGRLDIIIQEMNDELADALGLEQKYGVLVVDVKSGGSGEAAGLQHGDLITEFNGQQVINSRKLQLLVAESHIGDNVKLVVIRQGKPLELSATIAETGNDSASEKTQKNPTIIRSAVTFSNLSTVLFSKFGLREGSKGIVVTAVSRDRDLKSDLQIGDLVVAIDHQYIDNVQQFSDLYEKIKNDKKKNVILLVKRRELTIFVALPIK